MNDVEVSQCIETNIKKILIKNKVSSPEHCFRILLANSCQNQGLDYCLKTTGKSKVLIMIVRLLKNQDLTLVDVIADKNYFIQEEVIPFSKLCLTLGISEETPLYDLFDNKKVCDYLLQAKNQGFLAEWIRFESKLFLKVVSASNV